MEQFYCESFESFRFCAHSSWLGLIRQPKAYGSVLFDAIVIGSAGGAIGGFPAAAIAAISLVGIAIISSYGKGSAVRTTAKPREGLPKVRWYTTLGSGSYQNESEYEIIGDKPQRRKKSDGSWGYFFPGKNFSGRKEIKDVEVNFFYIDVIGEKYGAIGGSREKYERYVDPAK